MMDQRMRICPGCNATFGATEGHACATTVYAGQGAGHLAMNLLAEKAKEVDRLRSHVSRLEESLRVALEARAEAVEVLKGLEWSAWRADGRDDVVGAACCIECAGFEPVHAPDCRLARATGAGG